MSSSSSNLSSSSLGFQNRGYGRRRGFPPVCRCGEGSIIRTSKTVQNPGRLFHCCPYGSEHDPYHLFRWTDECMVEEIDDLKGVVSELKGEVSALSKCVKHCETEFENLEVEARTSEAVVSCYAQEIDKMKGVLVGYEVEIEDMKSRVHSYEKQVEECTAEIKSLKNIIICGLVLIGIVYYYVM